MDAINKITIDVSDPLTIPVVKAVQEDARSRFIEITLVTNGQALSIPSDAHGIIGLRRPNGTYVLYDETEDGDPAVTFDGNVATAYLSQEALSVAGDLYVSVSLYTATQRLTAFHFVVAVEPTAVPSGVVVDSDYFNILQGVVDDAIDAADRAEQAAATFESHASTHLQTGSDPIPLATTSSAGLVQLYNGVDSDSTTMAATPAAVKAAYNHGGGGGVSGIGENLLDNWYFKLPVNQREQNSYSTANAYTIDRWKLTSGSLTVGTGGITLNGTIVQILEHSIGLTVTASALLSDGTMITPTYDDVTKTFTMTATGQMIVAAKLEVGTRQTLAENGVLTEIPNISEQLERCQRFYYRMHLTSWQLMAMGVCSAVRNIAYTIPFPRMHSAPTMSSPSSIGLWSSGGAWATVQSFTVKYTPNSPNLSFDVYPASNCTVGVVYAPVIEAGGYIEFNADL